MPVAAKSQTDRRFVRTVRGDVRPDELGLTHCHEHAFILPGRSMEVNATLLLDDLDKTTAELAEFRAAGGRTIVDAQPIGPERAPRLQQLASERAGVHIVATTGFHRSIYYHREHFRFHEPAERLAERMIGELTAGMVEYDRSDTPNPTDARAGLLKFASEYHLIDTDARKVAEAVVAAHRQSGAPIITHTQHGTCGMEQVELLAKLRVAPSALLVSHLDRNPDIYLHEDVAAAGAYIVYDGISRTKYFPDSTIVELICRMVEAGHERRILLAMDMGPRTMWRAYGGGPGMTYLVNEFLPKLRRAGLSEETVNKFMIHNPAKALTFREL